MLLYFFLSLSIVCTIWSSESTSPLPYYTDKDTEIPYLSNDKHIILTHNNQKVFAGPEYPLVLWNTDTNQTLVAYKQNIATLINNTRNFFGNTDKSKIKVFLSANTFEYENSDSADESAIPLQKSYEEKRERELCEVACNLQEVANTSNMQKYILSGRHLPYEHSLRKYPTAPLFIVTKQTNNGPLFFHICPIVSILSYIPEHLTAEVEKIEYLRELLVRTGYSPGISGLITV
jgi:hypothetical protein